MKLTAIAAYALAIGSFASAFPITGNTVNCRSGPGTSYSVKRTYKKGQDVSITCQTYGTNVNGNSIWDKTSDGCYVADYYVKTGSDEFVTKKCGGSKIPGPVKNDYPYKRSCRGVDKWNYYKCQCTSFVAWRINKRLGIKFTNQYKGVNWGNANTWDDAAKKTGVAVNKKPVPGCIAQTNAGKFGHVAWVVKVSGDRVTVEEYNYRGSQKYSKRTVPKDTFNYIHVKV
ncbi:hypothetical protein FOMG_17799 [Fusarium oxysporum f. sp. melonis 26406]|uniref:Peptidase C51 domain-containing protein n=1 Tax=Fusarium oxysporum f. sp. melonis 26406 TaxID=1089452 RepID=W9ZAE8_FUSOX|nr:hypothetical protein FOMG_17799 [Fusarium oxysporum f. sp. melonis 26406]